ncbi:MAG: SCO1664 family protein, partial [Actinomadura sp.]
MTQPSPDRAASSRRSSGRDRGSVDPADVRAAEALLTQGNLSVEGRLVAASNATLYCSMEWNGRTAACVYKPVSGERPLWDFPDGTLAEREVAAYVVSEAMGWRIVPPTVHRDG